MTVSGTHGSGTTSAAPVGSGAGHPTAVTEAMLGFARTLRTAGVDAGPDRVHAMLAAVQAVGVGDARATYWAARLTLCREPDDLPVYDAAFAAYFGATRPRRGASGASTPSRRRRRSLLAAAREADTGESGRADTTGTIRVPAVASDTELLRHRDFASLSRAERAEVRRMVAMLAPLPALRLGRRRRPSQKGTVDPRRTLRRVLRQGGEPARTAHHRRRRTPRRLVLLLDVSGSMTPYADTFLRFAHASVRCRPSSTEAFTIGTRLTRITRPLRARDPDTALRSAAMAVPDWQGGTRLAETLRAFLDRWGRQGVAHGAVVVLASDGWERGAPTALAEQVARLSRLCHRLIWVNPHRGKPGYAPTAGGMAAALPYLDDFVAGHRLADLEKLAERIGAV